MLDAVWGEVRRQLRACLFAKDFDTWIAPLRATCFEAGELTIEVPSVFRLEWIREHIWTHSHRRSKALQVTERA